MHFRLLKRTAGVAVALLGLGCSAEDGAPEASELELAIVHGERSTSDQDAVVSVLAHPEGIGAVTCTGTLVAPNLVFTALHCVAYYTGGVFSCEPDGTLKTQNPGDGNIGEVAAADRIEIRTGADANSNDEPAAVGVDVIGTGSTQICRGDFAGVVLDRSLDFPIAPVRLSSMPTRGEQVVAVGYGATETEGTSGRFTRSGLHVIDVGSTGPVVEEATAAPRTFVVGEGPCFGDSGGPSLDQETGALLGVYSLVAGSSCTSLGVRNVYTSLAPHRDVALEAFERAGAEPVFEPGSEPSGEGGAGGTPAEGGAPNGNGDPDPVDPNQGSGSRNDANCTCRLGRTTPPQTPATLTSLTLALTLLTRRRRRRRR